MPQIINGIGTTIVPARGYIAWGANEAVDVVEWFVVLFLPLVPYKTVHAFNWVGDKYQCLPIRWASVLILQSFLRSFLGLLGVMVFFFGIFTGFHWLIEGFGIASVALTVCTVLLALTCWLGFKVWNRTDARDAHLRYLLGPHQAGTSDPATWLDDMLGGVRGPMDLYGTRRFSDAVTPLLDQGNYNQAMWAARLTVALEDPVAGETLTDEVLAHPGVQKALDDLLHGRALWEQVMVPLPAAQPHAKLGNELDAWGIQESSR